MILQIAPDAPLLIRAAATSALVIHIAGATLGLASGAVAMVSPKGGPTHVWAGRVFGASMLAMAGVGAVVAPMLPQRIASVAGLLTLYLTATAWIAVRRRPGQVGRCEAVALAFGLGVMALGLTLGWMGAVSPRGRLDGLPFQPAVIFAALAGLGAAGDLRTVLQGGLAPAQRLARHIWRMCGALLMTIMSLLGQPKAIPDSMEDSPLLFVPPVLVAAMMIYWLVRVRPRRPSAALA